MAKAYLILENGSIFEGESFGAPASSIGELVFTTGVVGYIETLTDPAYYGQIVIQTFPLIGNYGIIEEDFEGECCLKGYVVRDWCRTPSNFRSQYDLDTYLKAKGVPGICGVDTRELTKVIRENGVMNAMIASEIPAGFSVIKEYSITNAVESVTAKEETVYPAKGEKKFDVTMIDYGSRMNMIQDLCELGCEVTVVPAFTSAEAIFAKNPDGIVLTGGPGDPAENTGCIEEIKKLMGKVPMFGAGLGHQMMALAAGGKTKKLKYGHRGANQPAKDLKGTRTYITSQNTGYTVIADSLTAGEVRYINANDQTCEGIDYPGLKAFSVQFRPDTAINMKKETLIDRFVAMMGGQNNAAE